MNRQSTGDEFDALDRLLEERLRPPALSEDFARRLFERIEALPAEWSVPRWAAWLEAAAAAGLTAALAVAVSLPNVVKILTATAAPDLPHASWIAAGAVAATVLWFACEALADSGLPSR